ncbi:MAG: hypothetical protein AAGG07_02775 [Planctomycetota bacterium]
MLAGTTQLIATSIADLGPSQRRLEDFQNWAGRTLVHPIGGVMLASAVFLLLTLPRRFTLLPYLLMMCFAGRQRIVIGGLDFDFLRLMILTGLVRVILRREYVGFRLHLIDKLMIGWAIIGTITYVALHASGNAFIFRAGSMSDTLGAYLVFRLLIRDFTDVHTYVRYSVFIAVPVAYYFFIEKTTGRNMFSIFGGVPDITVVRDGKLRCQGAFSHPILAGSFWATSLALYVALMLRRGIDRLAGAVGAAAAGFIVLASASSTPIAAIGVCVLGWCLFLFRHRVKNLFWCLVALLTVIHFVLPKPVWHLLSRIDLVGGSTGHHRYRLIDAAVDRFSEWMLIGTPTTRHWGWGLFDVTNHYILEAVRGGAFTLTLFVLVLWYAFKLVGRAIRMTEANRQDQLIAWGVGVTLLTHAVVFIAVSYFGQIVMLYHSHLAMAAGLGLAVTVPVAKRVRRVARRPATPLQASRRREHGAPETPALRGLPLPKQRPAAVGGPPAPAQAAGPWARALAKRPPEQNSNGGASDV